LSSDECPESSGGGSAPACSYRVLEFFNDDLAINQPNILFEYCIKITHLFFTGVESFDIDMKEQKVTVKGNVKAQDVFDTVSKTGKKTEFWVEPENKPTETVTDAEPENKPSEAVTIDPVEPDNKPSETATFVSIEPENKPSETATVAA